MNHQSARPQNRPHEPIGRRIGLWLGIVLFVVLLILPPPASMKEAARRHVAAQTTAAMTSAPVPLGDAAFDRAVARRARVMMAAAAVTALVACWWITVAIPIPVTSLLPLALFPVVGVLTVSEAATPYANSNVFLFMGGFIVALAIERWGLHRRTALHVVRLVGTSRPTIVLGFMLASAFLSMWISNTACVLMMLPIGMAIVSAMRQMEEGLSDRDHAEFAAALMLGIAYAASVGGIGTPIGTPPNIAFRGQFARLFPDGPEISFGHWLIVFLPIVIIFLPVIWFVLVKVACRVRRAAAPVGRSVIREQLARLGPMQQPEKAVLIVFLATAVLWMTRSIPVGGGNFGWSALLERLLSGENGPGLFRSDYINDATVALCMAVLLFMIPARGTPADRTVAKSEDEALRSPVVQRRREHLMDWETAQRLPWGILLLFGGGFSIAAGFEKSGLSEWCGQVFAGLHLTDPLVLILATCLLMTFLTEITSNTATTQVMLPILARFSTAMHVNPLLVMLPATISASCAFMLPVATPPNAIVFGSGYVEMNRMVRAGIIINLLGAIIVTLCFYFIACPLLGIDPRALPSWAG